MKISAIAARASNGVIGKDGGLPWHLPDDLKFFKRTTSGHHIIMGRKSFDALGKPLKNRTNIVLTQDKDYRTDDIVIAHSLERAIDYARNRNEDECFIAGGAEVYRQALPILDRMYLTEIHARIDGDTYYPDFQEEHWEQTQSEDHEKDDRHAYPFTFRILEKI